MCYHGYQLVSVCSEVVQLVQRIPPAPGCVAHSLETRLESILPEPHELPTVAKGCLNHVLCIIAIGNMFCQIVSGIWVPFFSQLKVNDH